MVCLPDSTTSALFFHHRDTEKTEGFKNQKPWKQSFSFAGVPSSTVSLIQTYFAAGAGACCGAG
jgi:hypothetical protein